MEGNYLTAGDLALMENHGRGYGYHEGYCHKSNATATTGVGLAAGLGGGALLLAFAVGWGLNQASKARSRAAENLAAANQNYINQVSALLINEKNARETWQNVHAPSTTQYVDIRTASLAGAGSNALAQAEAQIVSNALTGRMTTCPTPVALYSAPQPCGCPNGCNG